MRAIHELEKNESISVLTEFWINFSHPSKQMLMDHRALAVISSAASTLTISGSMDGSTVHKVIVNAQVLTLNTLYIKDLTGDDRLFRHYKISLAPVGTDAVKVWRIGHGIG